jgi:hypothetical protein
MAQTPIRADLAAATSKKYRSPFVKGAYAQEVEDLLLTAHAQ